MVGRLWVLTAVHRVHTIRPNGFKTCYIHDQRHLKFQPPIEHPTGRPGVALSAGAVTADGIDRYAHARDKSPVTTAMESRWHGLARTPSAEIEWRGGEIPAPGDGHAITYSLQPYLEYGRNSHMGGFSIPAMLDA